MEKKIKLVMNKNDFKVGEWYKITVLHEFQYLIKVNNINSNEISVECGLYNFYRNVWDINTNGNTVSIVKITETIPQSIKDIQQYLPDSHPDKLKQQSINVCGIEMVVGEIYATTVMGGNTIEEFTYLDKNRLYSKAYIFKGQSFHMNGGSNVSDYESVRLATQEEKDWLLACKAAGKFVPKSMKLKKYVKCINGGKAYTTHPDALRLGATNFAFDIEPNNGTTYIVINEGIINNNTSVYVLEGKNGKHYIISLDGVAPSTEEAFNKTIETKKLNRFPSTGCCISTDKRLLKYLNSRPNVHITGNDITGNAKGIGWNYNSAWFYVGSSGKTEYKLADLEHFFDSVEIKEWSIGTYGVLLSDYKKFKRGFIDRIVNRTDKRVNFVNFLSYDPNDLSYASGAEFKWFATYEEAKAFAKTLMPITLDSSGSMSQNKDSVNSTSEWEPKVGDWVVFEVNKCVGEYSHLKTKFWCQDMVLKVENVRPYSLEFNFSQLQQYISNFSASKISMVSASKISMVSNNRQLFRKAEPHEIPLSLGGGSDMQYNSSLTLKLGGQSINEKPVYSVYIKDDKPKQKKEEPIRLNLTPRKNIKINFVV